MSVALSATDLSSDTNDIDLVQDGEQLFACVRTSYTKILGFSCAMEKWLSVFRYARMTSLKISKPDFSATISNIDAQIAPVNKGLNSASIRLQQLFRKYFRYARMTSLKFS